MQPRLLGELSWVDVQLTDYDSDHAFTVDPRSPHLRTSVQEIADFLVSRLG